MPQEAIIAEYLAICLMAKGEQFFARLGGSFTISFFSKQKALDITLPVAPLQLQRELARRINALETLKTAFRGSLMELDALFASLQYRAFRGEL